ncbi:hypothetical protein GH714_043945 [Hevea brasiliensis]|uniref:ABC transporter domain-containing protein n=1 Tax=Hevea brasiliensis TaxID=3981 RepID=A0A6A6K1G6_HEVBR|nr:hypothetical protein GH714_043945 [Hevea brasiliensis]
MDLSTVFGVSTRIPCLHSSPRARSNITENVAIEGRNLSFSFATRQGKFFPILKDCSLRVPSGQLWMLLGPNVELAREQAHLSSRKVIRLFWNIISIGVAKHKAIPGHGRTRQSQAMGLAPVLVSSKAPSLSCAPLGCTQVVMPTVEADVAFGLGKFILTEDEVRQRVSKALDDVGMSTYMQRPVQTLSGGQKQRVAIAGALAEACKVLLLDELTTFLDQNDQIGVIKAVKNSLVASDEITALWVTHRLEELEYADGAFYMENGRVVKVGDGSSIMDFINARQASYFNQTNS